MVNLTCVVNDTALPNSQLRTEHGLTFWITTEAGSILLDTGQSGDVLLHNLDILGLDPNNLKAVTISHAHYDHTGGLTSLAEYISHSLPLYANADLLRSRFSQKEGKYRSIGLPVDEVWLQRHFTLNLSDSPQQILPGVWSTGAITKRPHPQGGSKHHYILDGDVYVADPYIDDLSLVIEVSSGLMLLCGCCHAGLLNTIEHVQRTFDQPIVLIAGGTHLGSADKTTLDAISQIISTDKMVRRIYLNHCSGKHAYNKLRNDLGDNIVLPCPAGTAIDVEDILLN